jgi:hypothetical protein
LSIFIGYRDISLGTDTISYYEIYTQVNSFDIFILTGDLGYDRVELVFVLIISIFKLIGFSYSFFLFFLTFLSMLILYFSTILMFDKKEFGAGVVLFLLITSTFSFWSGHINILRHGIATSFFLLSLILLHRKKTIKSFVVFFISAGFHSFVLMVLPFWFFGKKVINLILKPIVVICLTLSFALLSPVEILESVKFLSPKLETLYLYTVSESKPFQLFSLSFIMDCSIFFLIYMARYFKYITMSNFENKLLVLTLFLICLVFFFGFNNIIAGRYSLLLNTVICVLVVKCTVSFFGLKNLIAVIYIFLIITMFSFLKVINITAGFAGKY